MMTHDEWRDLIPFYVAGTLSPVDEQAFKAYVARRGAICQREIDEWRQIAQATWQVVDTQVRANPLVSLEPVWTSERVARSSYLPNTHDRTRHPVTRRRSSALPMVAGLAGVIFFVVVLVVMRPGASGVQPLAAPMTDLTPTPDATIERPTSEPDLGIVATPDIPPPQPTFTLTAVPPPSTPLLPTGLPPVPTSTFEPDRCYLIPAGLNTVPVHRQADPSAPVVRELQPGVGYPTIVVSNGWHQIYLGGDVIVGWVRPEDVVLEGRCWDLWIATPTLQGPIATPVFISEAEGLVVVTQGIISLYDGPRLDSDILRAISPSDDVLNLMASAGDGERLWYQVQMVDGAIGWVRAEYVMHIPTPPTSQP